jgi:hypothetical protein
MRAVGWPAVYMILLLLLYSFGVWGTYHGDTEGMLFLPLMLLTTPLSWVLTSVWDLPSFPVSHNGMHYVSVFVTCNLMAGSVNALCLYWFLRRRRQRR